MQLFPAFHSWPRGFRFVAASVLLFLGTTAGGATKPSDVVLLDATLGVVDPQPPCPAGSRLVNARILSDGSSVEFSIPTKQVLVITAANFYADGAVADRNYEFSVFVATGSTLVHAHGHSDAAGQVIADATIPDGVVVKAGAALCAVAGSNATPFIPSYVRLHGYLAKDR